MGKAWYDASPEARAIFDEADKALGARLGGKLTDLCFSGPAELLNRTDISQPAIYTTSIACWRGLMAQWFQGAGEAPLAAVAGLSLGEYTALHIAGAFSFLDGLELVTLRGRAMQDAAQAVPSAMVALIGADEDKALAVCERAAKGEVLVTANFNAPGQVVLSGHLSACERAVAESDRLGLRAQMLPVAGAFHSPLMAPAAQRLSDALARTNLLEPRCPVISNVTALPHGQADDDRPPIIESVRRRLVEQLTAPVRWDQSCRWLAANVQGVFHELAPGKILMGLMRRIDRAVKVQNHDEPGE
jgi:[acyl-carrier-protein] S-malonyltransferase